MRMRIRLLLPLVVLCMGLLAGSAHARVYIQKAFVASAAQEVPTNGSLGTAAGSITVNTDTNILHYDITYQNLTSAETAAHIHGPAARGVNAGVLVGLPAGPNKVGDWNYPEAQENNILNGLTYVNIHTANNGGGEIRGQVEVVQVPGIAPWGIALLASMLVIGAAVVIRRRQALA